MNGDRIPREGHAGPTRVWILNARGYATMTGARCKIFRRRCESRKTNGLPWLQSGSPTSHGRTCRNMIVGTKTRLSGASQVGIDAIPVPRWSGLISTYDAKHARDMDSSRLRYDDGPSERCRVADRKTQQGCRVAGLAPACADTRSHMRQEDHGSVWTRSRTDTATEGQMLESRACDTITDVARNFAELSDEPWEGNSLEVPSASRRPAGSEKAETRSLDKVLHSPPLTLCGLPLPAIQRITDDNRLIADIFSEQTEASEALLLSRDLDTLSLAKLQRTRSLAWLPTSRQRTSLASLQAW